MILAKETAFLFVQLLALALSTNLTTKETRIIGGSEAEEDRYPYAVSLQDDFSGHFCGGALILNDVVLTAGHCVGGSINAVIGRHDFTDSDGEIISVRRQIQHPNYSTDTDENDMALLILERPVQNAVSLLTLNDDNSFPSPGNSAYVMGWGNTNTGNNVDLPAAMQIVDVEVVSNEECEQIQKGGDSYGKYGYFVTDDMICAYTDKKDACQGDSGGPLIIQGNDVSQDVLIGVVSWGIGCAYLPGVYSRVSYGYNWIKEEACASSVDTSGSTLCGTISPTNEPTTAQPTISPQPTTMPSASPSLSSSPSSPPSNSPTNSPTISNLPTLSNLPTSVRDARIISAEAHANSSNTFGSGVSRGSVLSFLIMSWLML